MSRSGMPRARPASAIRRSYVASSTAWLRSRRNWQDARCSASSVRTDTGKGSSARDNTGGASSSNEMRAITPCAASARAAVAFRACRRVQSSYSNRRLEARVSCPERRRGSPVFREQMGQGDRGVDVDQRSLRSPSSSSSNTDSVASGGPPRRGWDPGDSAGVNQPFRTASASIASARMGLLASRGGPISATTRPRSVTRTISPPAARRTYSLSLLFSALIPMDRMNDNVATGSYQRQSKSRRRSFLTRRARPALEGRTCQGGRETLARRPCSRSSPVIIQTTPTWPS